MILQPVVLAGGAGTRLWPLSRKAYPKQVIKWDGNTSLLQDTATRLNGLSSVINDQTTVNPPLVITQEHMRFLVADEFLQANQPHCGILLEPEGRNTAPAMTVAAMLQADPANTVLLIVPADQWFGQDSSFPQSVADAFSFAAQGAIATFGVVPTHAHTGYGYIQCGPNIQGSINQLDSFVEKPIITEAKRMVESGNYYWNSGMFMLRADVWLSALEQLEPKMHQSCHEAISDMTTDHDFIRINKDAFIQCPANSIDYAVMERLSTLGEQAPQAIVSPLSGGWSDLGSWPAICETLGTDEHQNTIHGDVIIEASNNCMAFGDKRLMALVGCDDIIVVDTADALLVMHKDHAQSIKDVVTKLEQNQRPEVEFHSKVYRPWGDYETIDLAPRYQVKRITVKPGATLSLQMHHHRAEHWVVVKGTAEVTRGEEVFLLSENESAYIPIGEKHRLANKGTIDLELIEVQSGSYLGEDDIVRFEDVYGREKENEG